MGISYGIYRIWLGVFCYLNQKNMKNHPKNIGKKIKKIIIKTLIWLVIILTGLIILGSFLPDSPNRESGQVKPKQNALNIEQPIQESSAETDTEKLLDSTDSTSTAQDKIITDVSSTQLTPTVQNKTTENIPSVDNTPIETKQIVQPKIEETKPAIPPTPQYTFYSVTKVVDGDTIKISMNGKEETLRLIGMDTPETVDPRKPVQCFGKEASEKAKSLLIDKKVRIENDATQDIRDKYDRLLVYVFREDGLFYNKWMIGQGYAYEYTYEKPYKYQAEFKAAQKSAESAQLGLWSPSTCNGVTTNTTITQAQTTTQPETTTTQTNTGTNKWYTSSYYTSKYYYPKSCSAWEGLSPRYLEPYDTLQALLDKYPKKTQSPQCE